MKMLPYDENYFFNLIQIGIITFILFENNVIEKKCIFLLNYI